MPHSLTICSALRQLQLNRVPLKQASTLHWASRYFTTTIALRKDYRRGKPWCGIQQPQTTGQFVHNKHSRLAQENFGIWSDGARHSYERISSGQLDAVEYLKAVAAEKGDISEAVRVSLLAEWQRLEPLPRRDRHNLLQAEKKPLARTVMGLIWTDIKLWLPLISYDLKVGGHLCYYTVAEGLESFIERWLEVDDDQSDEVGDHTEIHWRNNLFRALVLAYFRLDVENSADRALTKFFDVLAIGDKYKTDAAMAEGANPHKLSSLSPWGVSVLIIKELATGMYHSTSDGLYERFESFYIRYPRPRRNPKQFASDCAVLRLNHPTKPSFTEMYEYLKEHADEANPARFWQDLQTTKPLVQRSLDQTEEHLRRNGRLSEAEWISQIRHPLLSAREDSRRPRQMF